MQFIQRIGLSSSSSSEKEEEEDKKNEPVRGGRGRRILGRSVREKLPIIRKDLNEAYEEEKRDDVEQNGPGPLVPPQLSHEELLDLEAKMGSSSGTKNRRKAMGYKAFVDRVEISLVAGRGGDGSGSFHTQTIMKRTPDGGHGGKGGDIYLEATKEIPDLFTARGIYRAQDGTNGASKQQLGRGGKDLIIKVPIGTIATLIETRVGRKNQLSFERLRRSEGKDSVIVYDKPSAAEEEDYDDDDVDVKLKKKLTNQDDSIGSYKDELLPINEKAINYKPHRHTAILADLDQPGVKVKICEGGIGGRGTMMLKAASDRGMDFEAHKAKMSGQLGESKRICLTLKTIADVGLVGFPNAGKSTFLGAVSRAKPKTAPYPFTTIHPLVGVVEFNDGKTFTIADIPGLIEGAHRDKGLGHSFLQHIERTKILCFILDSSGGGAGGKGPCDPAQELELLIRELELYLPGLSLKPSIILANKMDKPESVVVEQELKERILRYAPQNVYPENPIIFTSALKGPGLREAVRALRICLSKNGKPELE